MQFRRRWTSKKDDILNEQHAGNSIVGTEKTAMGIKNPGWAHASTISSLKRCDNDGEELIELQRVQHDIETIAGLQQQE